MRIVMKLVSLIDEELSGAKDYIKLARRNKEEHPALADTFADLAEAEMGHVTKLHDEVARIIDEVRQRDGEPPAGMLAVYDYEHKKQIDKAMKIKQMIAEYRSE